MLSGLRRLHELSRCLAGRPHARKIAMVHKPASAPEQAPRGLRFLRFLIDSQPRRPLSFYLLLATPFVLLLSMHAFISKEEPLRIAFGLSMLFVFFGILLLRAIMDVFEIGRYHLRESGRAYRETLGNEEFTHELGERVDKAKRDR